jgi:hypothetical protein
VEDAVYLVAVGLPPPGADRTVDMGHIRLRRPADPIVSLPDDIVAGMIG